MPNLLSILTSVFWQISWDSWCLLFRSAASIQSVSSGNALFPESVPLHSQSSVCMGHKVLVCVLLEDDLREVQPIIVLNYLQSSIRLYIEFSDKPWSVNDVNHNQSVTTDNVINFDQYDHPFKHNDSAFVIWASQRNIKSVSSCMVRKNFEDVEQIKSLPYIHKKAKFTFLQTPVLASNSSLNEALSYQIRSHFVHNATVTLQQEPGGNCCQKEKSDSQKIQEMSSTTYCNEILPKLIMTCTGAENAFKLGHKVIQTWLHCTSWYES